MTTTTPRLTIEDLDLAATELEAKYNAAAAHRDAQLDELVAILARTARTHSESEGISLQEATRRAARWLIGTHPKLAAELFVAGKL